MSGAEVAHLTSGPNVMAAPLEKNAQPHAGSAETSFDLPNTCFMGSSVVSGVG